MGTPAVCQALPSARRYPAGLRAIAVPGLPRVTLSGIRAAPLAGQPVGRMLALPWKEAPMITIPGRGNQATDWNKCS